MYSQPELDQLESQAAADYLDCMADLAYEMCNALREQYEEPMARPEVIAVGQQFVERYDNALNKLSDTQ